MTEREAGIITLLSACIRAGQISGVHPAVDPQGERVDGRTKRRLALSEPQSRRAKLQADVRSALDEQRRIVDPATVAWPPRKRERAGVAA